MSSKLKMIWVSLGLIAVLGLGYLLYGIANANTTNGLVNHATSNTSATTLPTPSPTSVPSQSTAPLDNVDSSTVYKGTAAYEPDTSPTLTVTDDSTLPPVSPRKTSADDVFANNTVNVGTEDPSKFKGFPAQKKEDFKLVVEAFSGIKGDGFDIDSKHCKAYSSTTIACPVRDMAGYTLYFHPERAMLLAVSTPPSGFDSLPKEKQDMLKSFIVNETPSGFLDSRQYRGLEFHFLTVSK